MRFLIGVDEAGRGPLAGPLAVGAVRVKEHFDVQRAFPDARDSKVLSETQREEIYREVRGRAEAGDLAYCVRYSSNIVIDSRGIVEATRRAVFGCVRALSPEPKGTLVLLDGLLHAPAEYEQRTIVRGDASEPLISLASITAKVRRDHLMRRLTRLFPAYGFHEHKGYGTAKHREAIRVHGLSTLHRTTFCRLLISGA